MTVAWELVRTGYLLRSVRLTPFLPAAVVAVVLMLRGGGPDTVTYARELGLLLALGGGYALDDGAAETLRAGPYGLARRLGLRMGLAVVVVVPLWAAGIARTDRWAAGLTIELATGLAVVWAVAVWGRRLGVDRPGLITSPVLLALLLAATRMIVGPGPQWTTTHLRWSGVLAGATIVLIAGMRDPAARLTNRRPASS